MKESKPACKTHFLAWAQMTWFSSSFRFDALCNKIHTHTYVLLANSTTRLDLSWPLIITEKNDTNHTFHPFCSFSSPIITFTMSCLMTKQGKWTYKSSWSFQGKITATGPLSRRVIGRTECTSEGNKLVSPLYRGHLPHFFLFFVFATITHGRILPMYRRSVANDASRSPQLVWLEAHKEEEYWRRQQMEISSPSLNDWLAT